MLQVENLDVAYDEAQVLWAVSLSVNEREIVALLGSNGAGKTTLLRAISALLRPLRGCIRVDGSRLESLRSEAVVRKGIIHVPEGRQLFSGMTVEENLLLGAYALGRRQSTRDAGLEKAFALFPILKERKLQLAGKLSGGEQQMCAIARGLMGQPKLMLIDELSLGLAPLIVEELFRVLQRVNEEGVAILLVEQDVQGVLEIAHRGYVLEQGRIVMEGAGSDLLQQEEIKAAYLGI
jgi:branched-chain amino acid transport system ATP-binding protein